MQNQGKEITSNADRRSCRSRKVTLFIVDDSAIIVEKITELLQDVNGITSIKSCLSFQEAVDNINRYKPAVVLLDINLPGKSGIELLRFIKANYADIIVIMVTNQNSDYYRKLCLEIGAYEFVDKSKDFDKLPSILSKISSNVTMLF